jgi:hypothetical protein
MLRYALIVLCPRARRAYGTASIQYAWVLPVPAVILAIFAPEGSGAIIRKWALSPHLLLCSFQSIDMPISGYPAFPPPKLPPIIQ